MQSKFEHYKKIGLIGTDEKLLERAKRTTRKPKVNGKVYAHSWGQEGVKGVAINKKWGNDPVKMQSQLNKDVENMWHPEGTNSVKAVFDHEYGHELDRLLGLKGNKEVQDLYKDFMSMGRDGQSTLSMYGQTNIKEFIAEAWSEFLNNNEPRYYAKAIGELIDNEYVRKFK